MNSIPRSSLFKKLNKQLYKSIESATMFCKLRSNPYVELAHWLHQILQSNDNDIYRITKHFELNHSNISEDIINYLNNCPTGYDSVIDFSDSIELAIERSWLLSSISYNESEIRSARLLLALIRTSSLYESLIKISPEFKKIINNVALADNIETAIADSQESADKISKQTTESNESALSGNNLAASGAIQQFTIDLTDKASKGEIDPVSGRDAEISQIIDILSRRRQNNPLLAGEAGVGKTAVVEGFALRIAQGDVPDSLKNVSVLLLDMGLLKAGASMKGEFEQRLKQIINDVNNSPTPIILFIDEIHTLVGAGGEAGTGDAANMLKPALARGDLRTIGATTWSEYKKYIEKDSALTRRFQLVKVDEPSEEVAINMLRGITSALEKHHNVKITSQAIEAAVKLSHRYISDRQLPDKAVSLLDTACARVSISHTSEPDEIQSLKRYIHNLNLEKNMLTEEQRLGMQLDKQSNNHAEKLKTANKKLKALESQLEKERITLNKILDIRNELSALVEGDTVALQATHSELLSALADIQKDKPLLAVSVDEDSVASVVENWTGIPVGRMVYDEVATVLDLSNHLNKRIIGQDHALDVISKRIQTSYAQLDNPNKPIGVFMLAGPSGVGKTETALALAETLYAGEHNLITINMSEFQEPHTVSTLKGAPPGYVGYGEGGVLTEAVRRKPYSVILLDEIEKAHPDIHELFFQVFDKGWMEDGEGRKIDFRNTVILLTSNVGSELIIDLTIDPDIVPKPDSLALSLHSELIKVFPAAFLGRLITVPYLPLDDNRLKSIVKLQLGRVKARVINIHNIEFVYNDKVTDLIVSQCKEVSFGGRQVDSIITNKILPVISRRYLDLSSTEDKIAKISMTVANDEFKFSYKLEKKKINDKK